MAPHSHVILPRWVLLDRIQYYLHQTRLGSLAPLLSCFSPTLFHRIVFTLLINTHTSEVADGVSERPTCRVCQSLTCRFVYPKALAEIKEEISKTVMRRELDKDYALIHPGWEKDEGTITPFNITLISLSLSSTHQVQCVLPLKTRSQLSGLRFI